MVAANQMLTAARRVWRHVTATARDHGEMTPLSAASPDESLVSALCICVLGDRDEWTPHDWPPRCVADLVRHAARGPGSTGRGLAKPELSSLLEEGLAALDALAWQKSGGCFARVDHATQLRAVSDLESGHARLSRQRAAAFMDAFLTLAAEAYLHDARESKGRLAPAPIR